MSLSLPEALANLGSTTLTSSYTSGGSSIAVAATTGMPSSNIFHVLIADQTTKLVKAIFKVTAISSLTLSTTAELDANCNSGDLVLFTALSAGALKQVCADLITEGAFANAYAAAGFGRLWLPTDSYMVQHDNGSGLSHYGPLPKYTDPTLQTLTQKGNTTPTQTNQYGTIHLDSGVISGSQNDNWALFELASYPSTPWSIDVGFIVDGVGLNYFANGLYIRDSSNKFVTCQFIHNSGLGLPEAWAILYGKWASITSYTGAFGNAMSTPLFPGWVIRLKIRDDGTNITCYYSVDFGVTWREIAQESRTAYISTPAGCGFGFNPNAQTAPAPYGLGCNIIHWAQGT
jgi:hypothetical protein